MKAKVYPNAPSPADSSLKGIRKEEEVAVTVWRNSLLFNCKGFTVFDAKGDLRFRVDNYSSGLRGTVEIVLMDASGNPLLTLRRKRLSFGEKWLIYGGEEAVNPLYSVKKHVTLLHSKGLAHVRPCGRRSLPSFSIEGSYSQRRCTIYDDLRRAAAEVQRKEACAGVTLGDDVFRLIVKPQAGLDLPLAMAILIVLDQMHGSS